jgi:membrane protein implicated in regulation of membrane protease activity
VEVIFVKDMLYAGGGLLSVIIAAYFMWSFLSQAPGAKSNTPFIIAIIFGILALVCGALFLSGRVNKQEEIHITE